MVGANVQRLLIVHGSFEVMGGAQRDLLTSLGELTARFPKVVLATLHAGDAGAVCLEHDVRLITPKVPFEVQRGALAEVTAATSRRATRAWRALCAPGGALGTVLPTVDAIHIVGGSQGSLEVVDVLPHGLPVHYHCLEPPRGLYEPVLHEDLDGRLRRPWALTRLLLSRQRRRDQRLVATLDAHPWSVISGNSTSCAERVTRTYELATPAAVLHHAIDLDAWPLQPDAIEEDAADEVPRRPRRYVVTVGRATRVKGTLEALQVLAPTELGLVHVGGRSEADRQRLEAEAGRCSVPLEHATETGEAALRHLLRNAVAVISLAHEEPFGLTPVEAMAIGTPALMVDEGGFRDTVLDGETGRLLPRPEAPGAPSDPGQVAWTEALEQAQDPEVRARWAAAGRARVETHFTKTQHVERLQDLLNGLVARRAAAHAEVTEGGALEPMLEPSEDETPAPEPAERSTSQPRDADPDADEAEEASPSEAELESPASAVDDHASDGDAATRTDR